MMLGKGSSFRLKLMVSAILTVALIQSVGVGWDIAKQRAQLHRELGDNAAMVTRLIGDTIVLPLWDFDYPQAERMAGGLLADKRVGAVRLTDASGEVISSHAADRFEPRASDRTFRRPLIFDDGTVRETIGELEVVYTTRTLDAAVWATTRRKLIAASIVLVTIAISLYLVLTLLARPLEALTTAISRIRNGELDVAVPCTERDDEIGKVAHALDQLRCNETEVRVLRLEHDERARRERHRIRRALKSTKDAVVLLNEDGKIAFTNPRAGRLFGDISVGSSLDLRAIENPGVLAEIERCLSERTNFDSTVLAKVREDHRPSTLHLRVSPISDEGGAHLGSLLLASDRTEAARNAERARYLAAHDSLTGLANRRVMENLLKTWVEEDRVTTTVLLADLDRFKSINDALGHPVGDELLKLAATILTETIDDDDVAVRLAGDEFAVVGRGEDSGARLLRHAEAISARLRPKLRLGSVEVQSGISIGLATVYGDEGEGYAAIRRADLALDEAKRNGRGRIEVFEERLEQEMQRKTVLERGLRTALEEGAVRPAFQAQTSAMTRRIVGLEALARWSHPKLGAISPAEFIPIAEETGLITDLTRQMLIASCEAVGAWRHLGYRGRVAVNISPQIFDGGATALVEEVLAATGCPSDALEVEITEQVMLTEGQAACREIAALRELGVSVALDDFGVGYSSLSYLQRFPVDKIKIDQSFVCQLTTSRETRAIVVAIVQLGHALGMSVTGEGAQTEAHRTALCDCAVDSIQGFVDGRPMDLGAASSRIAAEATALAADAIALAADATALAPDATELAEATELAPDANELAPDATELAADATVLAAEVTELAAEASAPTANATELAADASRDPSSRSTRPNGSPPPSSKRHAA